MSIPIDWRHLLRKSNIWRITIKKRIYSNLLFYSNLLSSGHSRDDLLRIFSQSSGFFTETEYDLGDLEVLQKMIDMNRYSIENVMKMIQMSCDELFVKCQFEGKFVECSNLFQPVTSQYGLCCAFNKNGQYKYVFFCLMDLFKWFGLILSISSSRENGRISISVLLRPSRESFISSETMRFLMYESNTSASVSLFESILSRNTETFVDLTPELIMCSDNVAKASISQRNCVYEWEGQLKYSKNIIYKIWIENFDFFYIFPKRHFANYRELNCRLECILAKIENICQCLPYYYAMYSQTTRMCTFPEIKCLVDKFCELISINLTLSTFWKNSLKFHLGSNKEKNNCECVANCVDVSYQAVLNETPLNMQNFTVGSF